MTVEFSQILESIRATQSGYHKLTIIAGLAGSGKTQLLESVAIQLGLPRINLSQLLSQRLLNLTRRQRALRAEEIATEIIDSQITTGLCVDHTELLFDSTLRMNPLGFLQDVSRNRFIVSTWHGQLTNGVLTFAYTGHPDYFANAVHGHPVIWLNSDHAQLFLTT